MSVIRGITMFNTVIEAIKRLERNDDKSKGNEELLDYLHAEADKEISANMLNLLTYGDRIGWDRIEGRLAELSMFIRAAKERDRKEGASKGK
uniref:Uncharacterized protein n=1 Tax=Candidatus Kentrum sp. FM TaxID=2126340 RepID=A0A450T1U0_9GAMM|nr:MAG: hypothetical protein BECKFM1743C_GA0114222_102706 [Candidatus Kentron sp. FM]